MWRTKWLQKELEAKLKVEVAARLKEQDTERELASRQAEEERVRDREAVEEVGTVYVAIQLVAQKKTRPV